MWNTGIRAATQPVWGYIPDTDRVQATVNHRVHANGELAASRMFDQNRLDGWQHIGSFPFNGAVGEIRAYGNETPESSDPNNPDNPTDSRTGIDAAAMRCTSGCDNYTAEPAPRVSTIDSHRGALWRN